MARKPKSTESSTNVTQNRFNELLDLVARMMLEAVEQTLGRTPWTVAFFFERQASPESGVRIAKLRVRVPGESELKWVRDPIDAAKLMSEVWRLKDSLFPKPWYALKLTLDPDGKFETEYDYDPAWPEGFAST